MLDMPVITLSTTLLKIILVLIVLIPFLAAIFFVKKQKMWGD